MSRLVFSGQRAAAAAALLYVMIYSALIFRVRIGIGIGSSLINRRLMATRDAVYCQAD